jgi:DNA-binding NtrC family response regulator
VLPESPGRQRFLFDRFTLAVTQGPGARESWTFGQEAVQVGSAKANDVVLDDNTVSRFHLRIETDAHTFTLCDLGSTNGTLVNGVRVAKAFVEAAATIVLGSTTLRLEPLGEQTAVDLPDRDRMGNLIGRSIAMRRLYALLERVAPSELSVIIEGETGTGKEVVAHLLHASSARAAKPFEVLDCSAIPENLVESELFGHVKGAFTGADRSRAGVFERAQGGTVFIDEIGELDRALQPKLLRVLESGEYRRVGDGTPMKADVRVIAATHRSLRAMVNSGAFREDLYFRLAGCRIELPPLRERPEDVPLLVAHFLEALRAREPTRRVEMPDEETLHRLSRYPWPGNVRQLRNAVEQLAVLGGVELSASAPQDAPSIEQAASAAVRLSFRDAKEAFERAYLEALIRQHGGDVPRAAQAAEIHPKSLFRMLRRHAVDRV